MEALVEEGTARLRLKGRVKGRENPQRLTMRQHAKARCTGQGTPAKANRFLARLLRSPRSLAP